MFLSIGMLKQNYFLADIFILSAEKQPIKLSWRKIVWLHPPAMNSVKADDMTFTVNYTDGTKKNSKLSSDSEGVNRMLQAFNALKAGEVLCLTIPGSTAPAN